MNEIGTSLLWTVFDTSSVGNGSIGQQDKTTHANGYPSQPEFADRCHFST